MQPPLFPAESEAPLPTRPASPRAIERLAAGLILTLERHAEAWRSGNFQARLRLLFRDGPSRRLWLARLADAGQAAALGVRAQTLRGMALELLEQAGEPRVGPRRRELEAFLALDSEPDLKGQLEPLERGLDVALASLWRLLEAGFVPELLPPLEEAVAESRLPEAARERALALLRAAARLLEHCPGARPAEWAAADAAVLAHLPAEEQLLLVDPDCERPGVRELVQQLARRSGSERLELHAPTAGFGAPTPALERWVAADPGREMRVALERCARAIRAGVAPERIGLAVYGLPARRAALRIHAQRLALPLSGNGVLGPLTPIGRRLSALVELLRADAGLPISRLFDALPKAWFEVRAQASAAALRLGARVCAATRIESAAKLDLDRLLGSRGDLCLPVRLGAQSSAAEDDPFDSGADGADEQAEENGAPEEAEPEEREQDPNPVRAGLERQRLPRAALESLIELARSAQEFLALDRVLSIEALTQVGSQFVRAGLAWDLEPELASELGASLHALEVELGPGRTLSAARWRTLLASELSTRGREPLGGSGGGIQVASGPDLPRVPFELVVIAGLDRTSAPRRIQEDPLLDTALRRALAPVLPDLEPEPGQERDPQGLERQRFMALAHLAPTTLLLRAEQDEKDKQLAPSPYFLGLAERLGADAAQIARSSPTDLFEAALEQAPDLEPGDLQPWFERLGEGLLATGSKPAWALGRAQVLAEWSLSPTRGAALGASPYHGFVGALPTQDLSITVLESAARCGWRAFLERVLRLEPSPNPLYAWPPLDNALVGELVHAALEELVRAALRSGRSPVERPSAEAAAQLLEQLGPALAFERGLALPGLARVLIERAREPLAIALQLEWAQGPLEVEAVEWSGAVEALDGSSRPHRLRFRADRRDRGSEGAVLTDYKSGKPFSQAVKEDTRRNKLIVSIAQGIRLQGMAYALGSGPGASGRYVYLAPGRSIETAHRLVRVPADDKDLRRAFEASTATLLDAWGLGALGPRLFDEQLDKEPSACRFCRVREACVRQDSGQRGRLARFIRKLETEGAPGSEEAAFEAWFDLGRKAPGGAR